MSVSMTILYTLSKVAGTSYKLVAKREKRESCRRLPKFSMTDTSKEFFNSNFWRANNYGDFLLHEAANRSLDMTIERIGRERFEIALKDFRRRLAMVHEQCTLKGRVILPCSDKGVVQNEASKLNCYFEDVGCGNECIDEVVALQKNRRRSA